MPSASDKFIFVTGVVGRAMGSGKFTGADIQGLTDLAAQAFENTFVHASEPPAPQQPYSPPAGPTAMVPMPTVTFPESLDWGIWRADKCKSFDDYAKDASWEKLLEVAKAGDEKAIRAIKKMAESDPGDPTGKWFKANQRRAARAKTLQLMLTQP